MPIPLRNFFDSLPVFWKLATIRLTIYLYVIYINEWMASVEGFDSLSDMTPLQITKMHHRCWVAVATTVIAFLDSGMTAIQKNGGLTADDIKILLAEMTPASTIKQTTSQQTTLTSAPQPVDTHPASDTIGESVK